MDHSQSDTIHFMTQQGTVKIVIVDNCTVV